MMPLPCDAQEENSRLAWGFVMRPRIIVALAAIAAVAAISAATAIAVTGPRDAAPNAKDERWVWSEAWAILALARQQPGAAYMCDGTGKPQRSYVDPELRLWPGFQCVVEAADGTMTFFGITPNGKKRGVIKQLRANPHIQRV